MLCYQLRAGSLVKQIRGGTGITISILIFHTFIFVALCFLLSFHYFTLLFRFLCNIKISIFFFKFKLFSNHSSLFVQRLWMVRTYITDAALSALTTQRWPASMSNITMISPETTLTRRFHLETETLISCWPVSWCHCGPTSPWTSHPGWVSLILPHTWT